jgi:hypothetical protein
MLRILSAFVVVFSLSLAASSQPFLSSHRLAETEPEELAKSVFVGTLTGGISGYYSAQCPDTGVHFGNFFFELLGRKGLHEALVIKPGYEFYSWAASWTSWTAVMLLQANLQRTLSVGVPTMVCTFIFAAGSPRK